MAVKNFTAADGTALETYDSGFTSIDGTYVVTNLEINSNLCEHEDAWMYSGAYYNTSSEDTSQALIKGRSTGTNILVHLTVRAGASQFGYGALLTTLVGSDWTVVSVAKNEVYLAQWTIPTPAARASDHTVKVTCSGTSTVTIDAWVDGESCGASKTDSSSPLSANHPGFYIGECATVDLSRFDDWTDGVSGLPEPNVYDGVVLSENITVEPEGFYFGHNTRFTGSTDDLTQAFTCEANAKILTLGIVVGGSTNREAVAPTYNGVNLVQADITRKYVTSPEESCELWYMIDPPVSASYNIVIPNSGTVALYVQACSWRVSGLGDALLDNATGTTGSSANPTVNITPTVNGALIVAILGDGRNAAPTAQTGYNINRTLNSTFSDSNQYYLQTTAALWACTWTCLTDDWCLCVAAFKLSLGISVADCIQAKAVFGRN